MLAAIGTVLFWAAALVGAYVVLALALLILAAPFADHRKAPRTTAELGLTPQEHADWANHCGPYASAYTLEEAAEMKRRRDRQDWANRRGAYRIA